MLVGNVNDKLLTGQDIVLGLNFLRIDMPKAINAQPPAPSSEQKTDYALGVKMLKDIRAFWAEQTTDTTVDQVRLYRLGVITFSQWAAILGVDIGMTTEQFTNVCRANFEQAYANAPKFG